MGQKRKAADHRFAHSNLRFQRRRARKRWPAVGAARRRAPTPARHSSFACSPGRREKGLQRMFLAAHHTRLPRNALRASSQRSAVSSRAFAFPPGLEGSRAESSRRAKILRSSNTIAADRTSKEIYSALGNPCRQDCLPRQRDRRVNRSTFTSHHRRCIGVGGRTPSSAAGPPGGFSSSANA